MWPGDRPGIARGSPGPPVAFCDAAYYGLYGLGRRGEVPRRTPPRLKAPPFHDLDAASESIESLSSTWTGSFPRDCPGTESRQSGQSGQSGQSRERLWAFGRDFDERERAALMATPALRESLWVAYCRLTDASAATAQLDTILEATARVTEQRRSPPAVCRDDVASYYVRRSEHERQPAPPR